MRRVGNVGSDGGGRRHRRSVSAGASAERRLSATDAAQCHGQRWDSDGTAILYNDALTGGTRLTRNLCALLKRPYILVNARETPDPIVAAEAVLKFIEDNGIEVLNVAGPRASGWPAGYRLTADVIGRVIRGVAR
jgi:hypothetical protein